MMIEVLCKEKDNTETDQRSTINEIRHEETKWMDGGWKKILDLNPWVN
jgi:hypothetical protein